MKLSIVIPVYNEEKTLNIIYKKICDVKFPVDLEMIFVDDCSRDKSADIIRSIEKNDSRVKAIFKPNNSGKGSTLKQGIEQASGDIIIVQDADLEYNPAEIPALLNLIIENKADVVYGSRFSSLSSQVGRFYHYLGNKVLTMFSNFCSNIRLTDMETCYKAFRADIIKNVIIESERFGFEPEITAKVAKLCCSIHELPISYFQRSYAEGKKIGIKDGFEALWCIIKYNFFVSKAESYKNTMPEKYLINFGLYTK